MSLVKKILVLMTVAVMALCLVGCGDTTWVMKADDTVINSGIYIYYQTQGYMEAVYTLASEDINYYYYYLYGYSLLDDTIDDQTVADYICEYALDMCKQMVVTDKLFNELGLELSDDTLAIIDNEVKTTWSSSSEHLEELGISKASLEAVITSAYKEDMVFDAYYEIGGIKGTTEETINSYLEDEYARIKVIEFNFAESADDAIDADVKQAQLDLANAYLDRANAGEDMNALIDEYSAYLASLEASEDEENQDEGEVVDDAEEVAEVEEDEDPYANESIISVDSTSPSAKFVNYVFTTCNVGEYSLIQDDISFYLVQRLDMLEREDILEDYHDYIIKEIYDTDYTNLINSTLSGFSITENSKSLSRYTAENAILGPDHE